MNSIRVWLLFAFGLTLAQGARSQERVLTLNLNYSLGIPVGDLRQVTPGLSPRGWNGSILYGVNDRLSVGLGTGFQDFYHKEPRQLYKDVDGSDISAVVSYSIQTIPVLAQARYSLTTKGLLQPYVGLGIGGNIIMYRKFLGEFGGSGNAFRFAARPELGVAIPVSANGETAIHIGAAYTYAPYGREGLNGLNNVGVSAGIRFPLRR